MVASGLQPGMVAVAPVKLTLHLTIASVILAALVWIAAGLKEGPERGARSSPFPWLALAFPGIVPRADRARRVGRGLAIRADLQHLAADGRSVRSVAGGPCS
jgi:hypothetical protein